MFIVYVLKNPRDKVYIGQTRDIQKRLEYHNCGIDQYTRGKGPWQLIYSEPFATRAEAMRRERYFKQGAGNRVLKELIQRGVAQW